MNLLILVVDDEPDVEILFRQQFRRDLRAGRFTMEFAQSGVGALEKIANAGDASLILILSDINMPEMTGSQFLEQIHDDANGSTDIPANVPIIILTSAILDAEERSLLRRARRIVSKSDLSAGMLSDTIEDVLRQTHPALAQ